MHYIQYSIGPVSYSERYNFTVCIISYLMFFVLMYYVYVCHVLWFAITGILFIQHIYL